MGIGSLQSLPTTASALGGLVLSLPQMLGINNQVVGVQPQTKPLPVDYAPLPNPEALIFDYEGEQSVSLECDITDHYIEDNSSIQDQIALRPEKISTHGFIGELNDILPSSFQALQTAATTLTYLGGIVPSLSVTAIRALNQAAQAYQTANSLANQAVSAWNTISPPANGKRFQNKQQKAYAKFFGWRSNRTLLTVQTPWNIFLNCAIENIRIIQDADTQLVTDFEVTFKVLRFSSLVIAGGVQLGQGRWNNENAANSANRLGLSVPTDTGASFTANIQKTSRLLG